MSEIKRLCYRYLVVGNCNTQGCLAVSWETCPHGKLSYRYQSMGEEKEGGCKMKTRNNMHERIPTKFEKPCFEDLDEICECLEDVEVGDRNCRHLDKGGAWEDCKSGKLSPCYRPPEDDCNSEPASDVDCKSTQEKISQLEERLDLVRKLYERACQHMFDAEDKVKMLNSRIDDLMNQIVTKL